MNSPFRRPGPAVALMTMLVALAIFIPSAFVHARRQAAPPNPAVEDALAGASLHNPGFDNHKWYEFNDRYGTWLAKSWVPDDDTVGGPQDWRIWYLAGKDIIKTGVEDTLVQSVEAVWMRTYGSGALLGGLYQVVYDTTPCLTYEFTMYGQARPTEGDDSLSTLQVGIDRAGWHPDTANDPAVHGSFPSTTVWGTSHKYEFSYGLLSVTAEAWADEITVYTYADATGGTSHAVLWDTGSFADVTPDMIHDPDDLPSPGGISNIGESNITSNSARITWTTANDALGQVYYRLVPSGGTPPTYLNKIYLPLISCDDCSAWQATALNKTPTTSHTADLTGLESGSDYEYIIVSRGLSGDQCETWRSATGSFITAP